MILEAEILILKVIIQNTDLQVYASNDDLLLYALNYAVSEINKRRGYEGEGYEAKYQRNVIEGAIWRLSRLGVEGTSSTGELGVSTTWKDVPEWLLSVIPLVKMVLL